MSTRDPERGRDLASAAWRLVTLWWRRRGKWYARWYGPTVGLSVAASLVLGVIAWSVGVTGAAWWVCILFLWAGIALGAYATARGRAQAADDPANGRHSRP